ncbi:hypothetical protein OX284_007715 [Flavobacterium sp. SUN046]|uniref:hypothetical protein n=1 Tax=Flavobacterium sp. SUN046 TaxID=3002440 RepID=UPI002DB6E9A7|nr:hypothetical protein [Flavobacterium sp. SUN046]MEC4049314.1 hypothetical protein [Flavobacterium sp. SUN046]
MNKKEEIKKIKNLIRDFNILEQVHNQSLAVITCRKIELQKELDSLGASSSTRKGKFDGVLSNKATLSIIGSLTK